MGSVRAVQSGFTVVEILIAIFIFAIIVTTVFGSYRATSEQVEIVARDHHLVEMGRNCLDRITRDMAAIRIAPLPEYKPPGFDSPPDPYRIVGIHDSVGDRTMSQLRFTSFEHLPIRPSRPFGIARIVYYVEPDDTDRYRLYRSDQLYPFESFEPDPADPVLCAQVHAFDVTFYDERGDSSETWDSESESIDFATPAAVGIRLELGDKDNRQVFSTRVALNAQRSAVAARAP